jgi:hypothetical protein
MIFRFVVNNFGSIVSIHLEITITNVILALGVKNTGPIFTHFINS